ncbi:MAG: hypothetical protein BWK73_04075 [Thiothrix lacustris]|uniref:Ketoreductase domain-containing protein n=1 Tax=Thiothrix lacustris TaxID=525917 RepID=A0A1Y1QY00_9GAMM|nr:MAG: hypothetical protein BWK73_04075 [Thiothrix lacustris]
MDNAKKVTVITGAARGIGRATALLLAVKQPLQALILLDRDAAELALLQACIMALPPENPSIQLDTYVLDVTHEAAVIEVFANIQAKHTRVDILINAVGGSSAMGNAGVGIENMSLEQWQSLLALNLTSTFLCCRAAVPLMKHQHYGRIVNFSSIASQGRRDKVSTAYAASKAGIDGFTRKLAREVAPFGITCNAVAPGITLTERIDEKFWATRSENEQQAVLASIPLGRLSSPEEQAETVMFLASDASAYLTGQIIEVSGGI